MSLIIDHSKRFDNSPSIAIFVFLAFSVGMWVGSVLTDSAYKRAAEIAEQEKMQATASRALNEYSAYLDTEASAHAEKAAKRYVRKWPVENRRK